MKIAVPVWGLLISPVFDTAETLKVYDADDSKISSKKDFRLTCAGIEKARIVSEMADILICGAISNEMKACLTSLGLHVHPWVMGESDSIVESYLNGRIEKYEYTMPGCQRRREGRCRRGQGIHISKSRENKIVNDTETNNQG